MIHQRYKKLLERHVACGMGNGVSPSPIGVGDGGQGGHVPPPQPVPTRSLREDSEQTARKHSWKIRILRFFFEIQKTRLFTFFEAALKM